jgi:hypothetical protein
MCVQFLFNNCLLWLKKSTKRAILIALKGSNQIVICLINHVTRPEIYSKARSLNILYITFLMVMQLRNRTQEQCTTKKITLGRELAMSRETKIAQNSGQHDFNAAYPVRLNLQTPHFCSVLVLVHAGRKEEHVK